MSLAAALAAGGMRPASFLPAIKCSNCGDEIEIAAMGEHICHASAGESAPGPPASLAMPSHTYYQPVAPPAPSIVQMPRPPSPPTEHMVNPYALKPFNPPPQNLPFAPSPLQQDTAQPESRGRSRTLTSNQGPPTPKTSRIPPPRINAEMANRPFLGPPVNAPLSPAVSIRSAHSPGGPRPNMQRAMTSPAPRGLFDLQPPSPELSANFDCAFPSFPTTATTARRPSTSHGRKTPTNGDRAPSRNTDRAPSRSGSRLDQVNKFVHEPFGLEPRSPMTNGGENVMKRSNTLKSGPFNAVKRRQPSQDVKGDASQSDFNASRASVASSNYSLARRPSMPSLGRPPADLFSTAAAPPPLPTPSDKPDHHNMMPGFANAFSAEPESVDSHNESEHATHNGDVHDLSHPLSRMASEPELHLDHSRPPLNPGSVSEPSDIPKAVKFPSRRDSRAGLRMDFRLEDAPPVPKPVQQHMKPGAHAPSDSNSSNSSTDHSRSTHSSSGASPIGSAASSVEAFAPLNFDIKQYGHETDMRVPGLNWKNPDESAEDSHPDAKSVNEHHVDAGSSTPASPEKEQGSRSPVLPNLAPTTYAPPPKGLRPGFAPRQQGGAAQELPRELAIRPPPASRLDAGPRSPLPPLQIPARKDSADYDPFRARSPMPSRDTPSSPAKSSPFDTFSPASETSQLTSAFPLPPVPNSGAPARRLTRRGTVSRASCRGCGLTIEGKSVKAADGRLTGRWHKACFVCRTCRQPFVTADFYVIANEPYCEQHYHEQNNSLCHGCNRGIEGQYLETTTATRGGSVDKKFHPRCFTCCECREVLSDDYFELSGRVYCERHALASMRAQARLAGAGGPGGYIGGPGSATQYAPRHGGFMAERRTTRLMNMV